MRRLRSFALAAAASASLLACGDDGGNSTPDAPPGTDAPITPTCTGTATLDPAFSYNDQSDDSFINWSQEVTSSLGGGSAFLNWEFYAGGSALSGAINLTSGDQANYKTCSACVRLIVIDSAGEAIEKQFFQSGGTLNLTEDPFTNRVLAGSTTDLTLTEVTIADDYTSTPVSGGTCISLGSLTLAGDAVPAGWTCQKAQYNDGATCNCACGEHDPDCDIDGAQVAGCTGTQVCGSDDTCIDVCSVNTPTGCPANSYCGYESADRDVCYTDNTLKDAAALNGTCAADTTLFCAVNSANNVAEGLCDMLETDDLKCRKACDATSDCTGGGEICAPVIGTTKGICVVAPTNDTCATATALTIGAAAVNGSTAGAIGNYSAGLTTCTNTNGQTGGDVVYSVTLAASQQITVTLTNVSPHFDPSISIVGPGTAAAVCDANPITTCVAGADPGGEGAGETVTYTTTASGAGTYFIIVDTFYANSSPGTTSSGGTFSIAVTTPAT